MDGVVGVYAPGDKDLVIKTFLATGACQHRGKASAGIAVGNRAGLFVHKGIGRIAEVIDYDVNRLFQGLEPEAAIANIGYTKRRIAEKSNAEPIEISPRVPGTLSMVVTMDGYLIGEKELREELDPDYRIRTDNKTEILGALLHKYMTKLGVGFEAGRAFIDRVHGMATFSLLAIVNNGSESMLLALTDDRCFEPLCFAVIEGAVVISSESCSHRRLHGFTDHEFEGAEMVICSSKGIERQRLRHEQPLPDIFQAVYYGNVGSLFRGKEIFQIRRELGLCLVEHYGGSRADIVIPNPESGWGVTVGIAEGLKKPLYPALIKLPQAVRTFQEGERKTRTYEVGLKFGGVDSLIKGKNIAMGDDSIVRGSVSQGGSVWVVYNAGARYVEFWISYAPMIFPSFKEWHKGPECLRELAARRAFKDGNPYDKGLDEINRAVAKLVGVDEVRYNTLECIREVAGPGSFQALDASYPIAENHWPDWLSREVELFHRYR
jgi:amidophosphoribosyltransferase